MTTQRRRQVLVTWLALFALVAGCAILGLEETPESLFRQGRELYQAGRYDEAIAKFEDVIHKDPRYWLAYLYLARSYIAKLAWGNAITNARKAFELAPQGEDVVLVFAEALFGGGVDALRRKQFTEAIGNFVEYIRLKPTDPRGYLNVGKAYLGNGSYGDALSSFVRGLAQGGEVAVRQELLQGLLDGGTQALSRGDARSAIGFFSEYVRVDPRNFSAYLNLGKAYLHGGEVANGLSALRRALELSPGNAEALRLLQGGGR